MPEVLSIPDILVIANISEFLAEADIERGGLYQASLYGGGVDRDLPRKIYMVKKNVQWMYDLDPDDETLRFTANYLYALCNRYVLKAQNISGGGGSVSPINPSFGLMFEYLIPVLGGVPPFTNATDYDDVRIVGHNLEIFWNDLPRFLIGGEWAYTPTGIRILIPGFDASANTYDIKIFIRDPFGSSGEGVEVTRSFQYTGVGGETSFYNALLEDATIIEVSRGTPSVIINTGTPVDMECLVALGSNSLSTGTLEFAATAPISAGEIVTVIFSKSI